MYTYTFILMVTGGFNQYVVKLLIANIMSLYSYIFKSMDPRRVPAEMSNPLKQHSHYENSTETHTKLKVFKRFVVFCSS